MFQLTKRQSKCVCYGIVFLMTAIYWPFAGVGIMFVAFDMFDESSARSSTG